jgi:hypothetical protein
MNARGLPSLFVVLALCTMSVTGPGTGTGPGGWDRGHPFFIQRGAVKNQRIIPSVMRLA